MTTSPDHTHLQRVDAPVDALIENPENPRTITDTRLDALKKALQADPEMLLARPVIARLDGTVIAGNMRLKAARQLGWDTIPTIYVDLDDTRARMWLIRDNAPYGEWEEAGLAELLDALAQAGEDLGLTGLDEGALDDLLSALEESEASGAHGDDDDLDLPSDVVTSPSCGHHFPVGVRVREDAQ